MAIGATELGVAYLTILPSMQGFNRRVNATATAGGKSAGKLFGGLFAAFAGGAVTAAVGILTAKAIRGIKESIGAASALVEVQNKVNVVFGKDGAKALQTWSKGSAKAFGQSQSGALKAAANFAIFGKQAGLSGKDLTGFATNFTELASDMASFHDTTPEEAILAIGSAFRGEMEPIRRYGVLLDDAALRQEGVRLGIIKNIKTALTPQQKVLAVQSLILKQTSDAQGDFARTADEYANSQRRFNAQVENGKAALGKIFLPAATALVNFFNDKLIPVIVDKVIPAVKDFFDGLKKDKALKTAVDNLKTALAPLVDVDFKKQLDDLAAAIPPVVQGIADAITKYREFATAVDKFENSSFGEGDKTGGPVGQIVKDFGAGGTIEVALVHFRRVAPAYIKAGWANAKQSFIENHKGIIADVVRFKDGVVSKFKDLGSSIKSRTTEHLGSIKASWRLRTGEVATTVTGWKNKVTGFFKGLGTSVKTNTSTMLASIKSSWRTRTSEISATVTSWKAKILSIGTSLSTSLRSTISTMLTRITSAFSTAKTNIGRVWEGIKGVVSKPINWIKDNVYNKPLVPVWNRVAGLVSGPTLKAYAKGTSGAARGWGMVGERGPELVNFKGGEQVLPFKSPGSKEGGPVSWLKGLASSAAAKVGDLAARMKDWVLGGLKAVAEKILSPVKTAITNAMPRSGVGSTVGGIGKKAIDMVLDRIGREDSKAMAAQAGAGGGGAGVSGGMAAVIAAMRKHGARSFTTYPGHHPSMAKARDVTPHNWAIANTARLSKAVWYVIYQMKIASKNHGNGWRPFQTSSRRGDWQHRRHVHVAFYDKGGVLKPGLNLAYNGTGKNEIVIPQAGLGTKSVASAAPRPLRIQLDLGEDLRYYVEGIIDDQDEFKAGIGRLSR